MLVLETAWTGLTGCVRKITDPASLLADPRERTVMLKVAYAVLLVLHGGVHLLYLGQSKRIFELQPGMTWPDGSWTLSRLFGNDLTRTVASICLGAASLGLIFGGIALLLSQPLWRPLSIGALIFSSTLYIALWDGQMRQLANQGIVGLLISAAFLVGLLVFNWPQFAL
jgi:hypothetical protein